MSNDDTYMLTTTDNPFNPFVEFDKWLSFDAQKGYNTCGLLARLTITSNELSETDQELAIYEAMDKIVKENYYGVHKKVSLKDFESISESTSQS